MVIRKPLSSAVEASQPSESATSPTSVYSTEQSPLVQSTPFAPAVRAPPDVPETIGDHEESDDEWDQSDPDWDEADDEEQGENQSEQPHAEGLPAPLKIGSPDPSQSQKEFALPASLQAGPSQEMLRKKSQENLLPSESKSSLASNTSQQSNNPFLRPHNTGEAIFGHQSNGSPWPPLPTAPFHQAPVPQAPVELPTTNSPIEPMSKLSLLDEQPPLIPVETENDQPWKHQSEISGVSSTWKQPSDISAVSAFDTTPVNYVQETAPTQQVGLENEYAPQVPVTPSEQLQRQPEPTLSTSQIPISVSGISTPQTSQQSAEAKAKTQRKEHYQIKQIRWRDAYGKKLRISPILIQNMNGPCPLLALVNTLVLSTPVDVETALIETLRTREQISLGLLLDAVFDELMSGRRGTAAQNLPEVDDLYKFLLTLHTGMNVNPCFVFTKSRLSRDFHPALREHTQPGGFEETREMRLYSTFNIPLMHGWLPQRESPAYESFDRSAKTYEDAQNIQFHEEDLEEKLNTTGLNTEEQHLFEDLHTIKDFLSTWPTQLTDYGLAVLSEHLSAGQFAILFRNDHFSTMYKEPMSQQILTLVTDAGYSTHDEIVWESLVDVSSQGSEHFSGDFRPVSHHTPTTASGPAPGPRNSSLSQQPVQSMLDVDQGWTTVQNNRKKRQHEAEFLTFFRQAGIPSASPSSPLVESPVSPAEKRRAEQEDHDLALALQLQEEEEERARRSEAERRREDELSQQFLERDQQQRGGPAPIAAASSSTSRPAIPPRRGPGAATTAAAAPAADNVPPPSYDQAAKARPFHPPRDHPASEHAPQPARAARRQSAYMTTSSGTAPGAPGTAPDAPRARRHSARAVPPVEQGPPGPALGRARRSMSGGPMAVGPGGRPADEKCVVM